MLADVVVQANRLDLDRECAVTARVEPSMRRDAGRQVKPPASRALADRERLGLDVGHAVERHVARQPLEHEVDRLERDHAPGGVRVGGEQRVEADVGADVDRAP